MNYHSLQEIIVFVFHWKYFRDEFFLMTYKALVVETADKWFSPSKPSLFIDHLDSVIKICLNI